MFQHIRYRGVYVAATSAAGEVTIKILDLNEAERVNFRDQVNGSIRYLERVKRQLQGALKEIERRSTADPAALAEVIQEREALQNDLAQVQRYLTNLSGNS